MELDMEQSATEVCGAFYNLPSLLLNGFRGLGIGGFKAHFQHREKLWSAEGFGCADRLTGVVSSVLGSQHRACLYRFLLGKNVPQDMRQ